MSTTITLAPPPTDFFTNIITNLRNELDKANAKLEVAEKLLDELIYIAPQHEARQIVCSVDTRGYFIPAHEAVYGHRLKR